MEAWVEAQGFGNSGPGCEHGSKRLGAVDVRHAVGGRGPISSQSEPLLCIRLDGHQV